AVGSGNGNVRKVRQAADALARSRMPLAASQVQYSLLHREPETDGVLDACRRMDVALVAYEPFHAGAISAGSPTGSGQSALADTLGEVAAARGATAAQVALAWLQQRADHDIRCLDRRGPNASGRTQAPSRWNSARMSSLPSTGYRRRRRPSSTGEGPEGPPRIWTGHRPGSSVAPQVRRGFAVSRAPTRRSYA